MTSARRFGLDQCVFAVDLELLLTNSTVHRERERERERVDLHNVERLVESSYWSVASGE